MLQPTKDIYTENEKKLMIQAIKKNKGVSISVAKLASVAGINPNRARFVLDVLVESGKVIKVPVKSYNKHYSRYTYEVK